MQKKNQLLRIGSILMILGAAMAMLMAMATASTLDMGMSTVNSLTQDPAFMADLEATGMTLDQVLAAAKNLLTAVMGMMAVFNVIKIVVGALGLRKLQSGTVYFTRPVGLWQFALCGGHPVSRGLDKRYQFPGGLFADLADLGLGDCRGRVVSRLASDPDHAR